MKKAKSPKPVKNTLTAQLKTNNPDRRNGYQIQFNSAEVNIIDTAAARHGLSRAAFVRQAAIEKATGSTS